MAMRPTLRQLLIGLGTLQNFTAVWKGQDITPRPIVDRMVKMHETKRVVDGTSRATPGWCPPYTGSVTAVDTNMLERVRHDREGTRTGAHELVHVLAIARQEQLETVQNDDKPKNETGAAAQAGGVLAEEEPDWTYDAAADLIDQLLGLQPADSEDEGAIVWVAPTDQE